MSTPADSARFDGDPTEISVLVAPQVASNCTILYHVPRFVQLPNGLLYIGSAGIDGSDTPPDQLHRVLALARTSVRNIVIVLTDVDIWVTSADDVPSGALAQA